MRTIFVFLIRFLSRPGVSIIIRVLTERFEIPGRQCAQLALFAGVLVVVGVLLDVLALAVLKNAPIVLLMWGIGLTLGGLFALYAATACSRAYTEITAVGVRTRGLFGTKRAGWADVTDIQVYDPQNRGTRTIKVVRSNGKTFQLGAPTDSPVMSDPEFNAKLQRIVAAWHRMSVAAGY
jgi:hypothetical protein